jgi:uncharacterized protein YaaW (UPF0174 family)
MDELQQLLKKCSPDERVGLSKILGAEKATPKAIIDELRWNYQPWWNSLFGCEPDYREIVEHIAQHLRVSYSKYTFISDLEIKISQKVLETVWEKMTPKQREEIEAELRKAAQEYDKTGSLVTSGSIFATLTAAKLSGFGIYLLASTALGALTGAVGIALPFAVYMAMSVAIKTIIGPVGWIGATLFALWQSGESNKERLIPAIVYICMLRSKYQSN